MNTNGITWNYNMDEAPGDGTKILLSDGKDIWLVGYEFNAWYCDEGHRPKKEFIAWTPFNLPLQKDDYTQIYVATLEDAWDNWVDEQCSSGVQLSSMSRHHAVEIENAVCRLVEHCLHKSRPSRIVT